MHTTLRTGPPEDPRDWDALREIRDALLREGYIDCYHVYGAGHLRFRRVREQLGALPGPLGALVRLFFLGEEVAAADIGQALTPGELAVLRRTGLLVDGGAGLHTGGRLLLPVGGPVLVVPAVLARVMADCGSEVLALAARLAAPPGVRCVDLGPGPALQALLAAAGGTAVALSDDDEAAACAGWSAALSGLAGRLEVRHALDPGERFDLAVAALPLPADGDTIRGLLARLLSLLAPGGTARLIAAGEVDDRDLAAGLGAQVVVTDAAQSGGRYARVVTASLAALRPMLRRSTLHTGGFHDLAARAVRELPALGEVCARHGLPLPLPQDFRKVGEAVIFVSRGSLVKLMAPHLRAHLHAEAAALRQVHGRLGVGTPALLAEGEAAGWPYVVLGLLPGRPLSEAGLTRDQRLHIAAQAGAILRQLHALPADVPGLDADWPAFLRARCAACAVHQRQRGVRPEWLAEIPGALEAAGPLAPPDLRPVLLHTDVSEENLLVDRQGGAWEITGLVDFADARIGGWEYDLVVPGLSLARGDGGVLRALLDGYGVSGLQPERLVAFTWLHASADLAPLLGQLPAGGLASRLWPL
jgi:hygromycin-B 7''-O-kinase